jgi:PHD/YefM family antitoxin component YafN of YafNO toxin-antitoxin module
MKRMGIITKHGRDHTVLLSAAMYETLVCGRNPQQTGTLDAAAQQVIAGAAAVLEKR